MRRIIFSLLLLLLLICGLFLVFSRGRNSKTELSKTRLSQDRKFVNGVLSYLGSRSFQTLPYRVLPYGDDSVAFLTETGAFIGDPELHKCIQVQPPEGYEVGLYYLYRDEGRKIAFSVERNAAIIQSNTGNREMQPKGKAFNSIVAGNNLYCVTTDKQMSKIFFEQINLIDGTKKIIADQQSLFANDLIGRSACIEQILEGNFFRINNTMAGFYFYRIGKVLIFKGSDVEVYPTLVNTPFPNFREQEVAVNGFSGVQCLPESGKDVWIQMSACSDGRFVYILSNVSKSKNRIVDLYDVSSMKYVRSIPIESVKGSQASDILVTKNRLIVCYEKGLCISYRLPE